MGRHYEHARRLAAAYGGSVEKFIGDAVVAVFGLGKAHEDDAARQELRIHMLGMRLVLAERTHDAAQLEQARSMLARIGTRVSVRRGQEALLTLGIP